jgi:hypothetical protein
VNFLKAIWAWLGDSKEQIVSISALIGVFIAISGLRAWRKELKGKSEYEKAKEILKAVYLVRERFKTVRAVGINSYEYPGNLCDGLDGRLLPQFEYEGTSYAYQQRMKVLDESFNELEHKTLDAQVEWPNDFENVIAPMRFCRVRLMFAIYNFVESKRDKSRRILSQPEIDDLRLTLNYMGENVQDDTFTTQINNAVALYERKLRPHINGPSFGRRFMRNQIAVAFVGTIKRLREQMYD